MYQLAVGFLAREKPVVALASVAAFVVPSLSLSLCTPPRHRLPLSLSLSLSLSLLAAQYVSSECGDFLKLHILFLKICAIFVYLNVAISFPLTLLNHINAKLFIALIGLGYRVRVY
jgi:hypothetical protein